MNELAMELDQAKGAVLEMIDEFEEVDTYATLLRGKVETLGYVIESVRQAVERLEETLDDYNVEKAEENVQA
jgi:hypothetical protein